MHLVNNFNVDNQCKIINSSEELISLYTVAVERLKLGNFDLRSLSTTQGGDIIEQQVHSANFEKQFENYQNTLVFPLGRKYLGTPHKSYKILFT